MAKHRVGKKATHRRSRKGRKSSVKLEPTLKHMSMHKGHGGKKSRRKRA
jgi:hypothetical protein